MSNRGRGGCKRVVGRRPGLARVLALGCGLATVSGGAHAQVFQTDVARTPLPQPVGTAELGLGTSWGYDSAAMSYFDPSSGALLDTPIIYGEYFAPPAFPQFVNGDAFTLQGLFKWRGERIAPIADAKISPGHFFPGCGFKAELVLHGGDCDAVLGWYNFTGPGAPPAAADIQPLVPKGSTYLHGTHELVPLGWDNREPRNLSTLAWTPQAFSSGDITASPHYTGGDIAFALVGAVSTSCKATKFSAYEHNAKNSNGVPWVTSLTYRSTVDPTAIYLAFEDLPMLPEDWHQAGGQYTNDGDFNDAVFFISGLGATEACPDPACATVACDPDMTCSSGICVPAGSIPGSGGPSAGGAGGAGTVGEAGGAGEAGDGSNLGRDLGGAGPGQPPSDGTAGDSSNAAGAPDTPSDGSAGAPSTTTAGANGGGRDSGAPATSKGCSFHVAAAQQQTATSWLGLALAGAIALRRRRNSASNGRVTNP